MAPIRLLFPALLAAASLAPGVAKTPEEFVEPGPAADSARPARKAPDKGTPAAPAKAAASSPAAKPAPAASAVKAGAAPADSSRRRPAVPAGSAQAAALLDTARIHSLYLEGDFDQAVRALEGALRGKKTRTHADSVFIFKHLGVMYAASAETREKGRYYMLQLISIEPTARILDMYASDMIYLIFRNVQEEYEKKRVKPAAAPAPDTALAAAPAPAQKDSVAAAPAAAIRAKPNRTLYWAAGGAAVAAGAAALLFILFDDPQPKRNDIVLNE